MLTNASEFRTHIKRLYSLYQKKYEEACVWREHERAIAYNGHMSALEHVLIEAGEGSWVNQQRSEMEDRRNKLNDFWREMNKK